MASKKENILDLSKYLDAGVRVKFQGGREVVGILKGFDQLVNLVLDEAVESLRDPNDMFKITDNRRTLGKIVCRGTQVALISPTDGAEEIANPFIAPEE